MVFLTTLLLGLSFFALVRVCLFWKGRLQVPVLVVLTLLFFILLLFGNLLVSKDPVLSIKIWMTVFFPMLCAMGITLVSLKEIKKIKKPEDRLLMAMAILTIFIVFGVFFGILIW